MGKTQKETNPTVAGQRKRIKGCEAEQLRMDRISNGLGESNDSSISDSKEEFVNIPVIVVKFPNFYRTTEP